MREINLVADLLARHHPVLRGLQLLSRRLAPSEWCLVGGLMVLVAGRSAGRTSPRSEGTKDGDIVVDLCADPTALARVAAALTSVGFTAPTDAWQSEQVARCTFVSGHAQIDVLGPDDASEEPREAAHRLTAEDKALLSRLPGVFVTWGDEAWRYVDQDGRNRAVAALDLMTR